MTLYLGAYPNTRLRRPRLGKWSREMLAETGLAVSDLIWPIFIHEGSEATVAIPSMPGVSRCSIDESVRLALMALQLGIPAIGLFPAISQNKKDAIGVEALNPENLVCRAVRAVRNACPDLGIICDVALDPFTTHGHDGLLNEKNGTVLNDETVSVLCEQALVQAKAGCNVIAPSDMMDGRVAAIRRALDANGYCDVMILSYAVKYASAFYGPFRDAIGSATLTGRDKENGFRDKSSYQMDPANTDEALREVALDIQEGADMVMVKPGMPYLDVLYRVRKEFGLPTLVYQVSGEYSMLMAAIERGWLDRKRAMLESLLAFKRAGASAIFTYFALEAAQLLNEK